MAAGLGTRLKPLTDSKPKALVEVAGVPMLERVIRKLKAAGFDYIVVNVHHFGNDIKKFLAANDFGVEIHVSDENETLLDTGGGLVKASEMLFAHDNDPVLVHNVDIISNASFQELMKNYRSREHSTVLLISERDSSRKLIFDKNNQLIGWHNLATGEVRHHGLSLPSGFKEYAFSGIYVMGKEAINEMKKLLGGGKYSIIEYFLHPDRKLKVTGFEQKDLDILDIGKPATLSQASIKMKKPNLFY